MKISKQILKKIIKEELLNEVKIVKFNSAEMDTLHQNGEIYKDDIVYQFQDKVNELGAFTTPSYTDLTGGDYPKSKSKGSGSDSSREHYQGYSSREAKRIIDKALKMWAKDLRKSQYRVIKDWMSKAKAGVIDYFDLVRGFQQGDAKRANPYEVDFLMSVLSKDKIIDRFRKYFGGKKGKKR